jgi:hypothetical protein
LATFYGDPTPQDYNIEDNDGNVSNDATVTIDYIPVATADASTGNTTNADVTLNILTNDVTGDAVVVSTVTLIAPASGSCTSTVGGDCVAVTVPGEGVWTVDELGNLTFNPETGFTSNPTDISYTVEDGEGNVSAPVSVTVTYTLPPTIDCPDSPIDLGCNPTLPNCEDALKHVTATDGLGNEITPICEDEGEIIENGCQRSQTYTIMALTSENANGSATCEVTFTWKVDTEVPVLAAAPAAVNVSCINAVPAMTSLAWNDNCDAGGSVEGIDAPLVGSECGGTITRTWNITDACDNPAETRTQIITILPPVVNLPPDGSKTVACKADANPPVPPVFYDNCGRKLAGEFIGQYIPLKWGWKCEGTVVWLYRYTDCAGKTYDWKYAITVEYEDFQKPMNDGKNISSAAELFTPTPPVVYDNCSSLLTPTGPVISTSPEEVKYVWTYTDCEGNSKDWTYTFSYIGSATTNLGNTEIFGLASSSTNRRAMPVTFTEAGQIQSISVYHNAGSGNVILGVYSDLAGKPSALLGVTPSTAVRTTAGWQTVSLTTTVTVTSGQKVWLAWVFENAPYIRYVSTSTPASVVGGTWSLGMQSTYGTSYNANFKFSVYCTYTTGAVPDVTKPIITAFTIPANSASLVVPVNNFTATDNKAVTGFKLTETSTAPLAGDAGWTTVAPASYTFATAGTKTLYAWAKDEAGNVSTSESRQVIITLPSVTATLGSTEVLSLSSSSKDRRAIPVTFTEAGQIQSISVYHNAGSGNVILGVYSDVAGKPSALLGVTPSTVVRTTAGWQTVTLTTPVPVITGQKVWLAWVFQNIPYIRFASTSTPASVVGGTWSSGMESTYGTSYNANYKFSVYCTYIANTKSAVIAGEIEPVFEKADLKVYPNPFSEKLRFEFISPESVNARIDLYDMTGRLVKTIFEQPIEGGINYEAEFKPETIISGMYIYRMTMGENVYNGKVVFKKK